MKSSVRAPFVLFPRSLRDTSTLHWRHGLTSVDNNLFVQLLLGLAPLDPLPGRDPSLVEIEVKHADLAVESAIASVPAEAGAARVAHPKGGLFGGVVGGEGAVLVCVVTDNELEKWVSRRRKNINGQALTVHS